MDSVTRQPVSDGEMRAICSAAFPGDPLVEATPLGGGYYNAVYRLQTRSGREGVLKVAPPPELPVLRYERGLMATEIEFLEAAGAAGVPTPRVLHADTSRSVIDRDHFVMSVVPGVCVPEAALAPARRAEVHRQTGVALARLHAVSGRVFGYDRPGLAGRAASWPQAVLGMVDDVLADARDLGARLPTSTETISQLARERAGTIGAVSRPALLHFDLWDGNVFVDPATGRLTGVVDGERTMFGDPLADLVGMLVFEPIERRPLVIEGYAEAAAEAGVTPLVIDDEAHARMSLYRLYLLLVMAIEPYSRHFSGPEAESYLGLVRRHLVAELDGRWPPPSAPTG